MGIRETKQRERTKERGRKRYRVTKVVVASCVSNAVKKRPRCELYAIDHNHYLGHLTIEMLSQYMEYEMPEIRLDCILFWRKLRNKGNPVYGIPYTDTGDDTASPQLIEIIFIDGIYVWSIVIKSHSLYENSSTTPMWLELVNERQSGFIIYNVMPAQLGITSCFPKLLSASLLRYSIIGKKWCNVLTE